MSKEKSSGQTWLPESGLRWTRVQRHSPIPDAATVVSKGAMPLPACAAWLLSCLSLCVESGWPLHQVNKLQRRPMKGGVPGSTRHCTEFAFLLNVVCRTNWQAKECRLHVLLVHTSCFDCTYMSKACKHPEPIVSLLRVFIEKKVQERTQLNDQACCRCPLWTIFSFCWSGE